MSILAKFSSVETYRILPVFDGAPRRTKEAHVLDMLANMLGMPVRDILVLTGIMSLFISGAGAIAAGMASMEPVVADDGQEIISYRLSEIERKKTFVYGRIIAVVAFAILVADVALAYYKYPHVFGG